MLISRVSLSIGIAILLTTLGSPADAGQDGSTVVAEVGGHKIVLSELEQKEAGALLQARNKYYLVQRQALDHLVDDQLLEMEARRENISVDELLKRHVDSQVKEPSEDQLRFFYEGLASDQPYDAVRDKILDTIHRLRQTKARSAYLESLRSERGVVIELNPPTADVSMENVSRRGAQNAPVQVVEFADYECPFCQKVSPTLDKLQQEFGSKVALVFKDFPLPMHSRAQKAAEAARCAGSQGKFWEFHDALFANKTLEVPRLKEQAGALKLDTTRFDRCLDSGEQSAAVQKDLAEAQRLGLTGTPVFFVNGHFMSGAVSYEKLRQSIQEELAALSRPKQVAQR
jgi:protein-disulfide isomerase